MAVNWCFVSMMDQWGLLRPGMRVLDIGSSNLYNATAPEIAAFFRKYNPAMPEARVMSEAERLAAGSYVDPVRGASNKTFLGEVFDAVGIGYLSFDIAVGYKTEVADFNTYTLPARHRGAFDLVLNFGTTEHIIHQFNSFKIIHEAARPGGVIWNQLPGGGYVDHCYFTYHPRFFLDLAMANGYGVERYWISVGQPCRVFDGLAEYAGAFPAVADFLANPKGRPQLVENVALPDVGINAVYRKTSDRPFRASIERTTSVGAVPDSVMKAYTDGPVRPALLSRVWRGMKRRIKPIVKPVLKPLLSAMRGR